VIITGKTIKICKPRTTCTESKIKNFNEVEMKTLLNNAVLHIYLIAKNSWGNTVSRGETVVGQSVIKREQTSSLLIYHPEKL